MSTTTVIFALSIFIIGTYAECPSNPKQRAKECGAIFAQFGQKADESKEALFQHCPEVYEALDCLRDIINDCEMYQKLGLTMSDEQYAQMKRPLDNVCNARQPLLVDKEEVNKVLIQVGSVSYRVIFLADFLSPNSGATAELADSNSTEVAEDLNTSQTNESLNSNTTDTEQPEFIPTHQCAKKMMSCSRIGQNISSETNNIVKCIVMSEMAKCLNELSGSECESSVPPEIMDNMRKASKEYNTICSGQPSSAQNNMSPVSEVTAEIPDSNSAGVNEFPDLNTSQGNEQPDTEIPAYIPAQQCVKKMISCSQFGRQAGGAMDNAEKCRIMGEMADCMDELLDSECGSAMPPAVMGNLRMARKQYNEICLGQPSTVPNVKRSNPSETERRPCPSAVDNDCKHHIAKMSEMTPSQNSADICSHMNSFISCMEETYVDCTAPEGHDLATTLRPIKQSYGEICSRVATTQIFMDCINKVEECSGMLDSIHYDTPASERCPKVMAVLQCIEELIRDCSVISGVSELRDFAQPMYQRCVDEGWVPPQMKRNVPSRSLDGRPCPNLVHNDCNHHIATMSGLIPSKNTAQICSHINSFISCMEETYVDCTAPEGYDLATTLRPLKHSYNVMCTRGEATMQTVMECKNKIRDCTDMLYSIQYHSPARERCPEVMAVLQCGEDLIRDCSVISGASEFKDDVQPLYQRCVDEGWVPPQMKRNVPGLSLDEKRCSRLASECASQVQDLPASEHVCVGMSRFISCIENVTEQCENVTPEGAMLTEHLSKAREDYNKMCGHENSETVRGCETAGQQCKELSDNISMDTPAAVRCPKVIEVVECGQALMADCSAVLDFSYLVMTVPPMFEKCMSEGWIPQSNKRSVSVRSMDTFECVLYFKRCENHHGQKPFTKVHEIEDCDDLDNNIRCNDEGIELCQHILPDYDGAKQKIADARTMYNEKCKQPSKRSMSIFDCLLHFKRCTDNHGQKPFHKVHEITDCGDLDNNIRCNEEGVNMCPHILPDYNGVKQKIAEARTMYNERCGSNESNRGKRSMSKRRMSNFRCVLYFQRCQRRYGQKAFDEIHEITDCGDLENNIRCNDEGLDFCDHIIAPSNYEAAKQKIAEARIVYNERCGSNESSEAVAKRDLESECISMSQECVAMVGRFQFTNDLSVLCGFLNEVISCMENVINHCSNVLPNILETRLKLARTQSQVGSLCKMQLPGGTLPTPTGKQAECRNLLQSCLRLYSTIDYSKGLAVTCGLLRTIAGCYNNVVRQCRNVLPNTAQIERNLQSARSQILNVCPKRSVSKRSVDALESNMATRDLTSECTSMSQECVSMAGRFQYSSDLSVLCGDLNEIVSCMENLVNHCSDTLPNIVSLRQKLARSQSQVRSLCSMQLPGGTLPTPTGKQAECVNLLQGCMSGFSSIDYSKGLEDTCNGLRSIVGCFQNLLQKCRRILPNAAQVERNMNQAQRQVSNTCAGTGNDMTKSSSSTGGATVQECGKMNSKCLKLVQGLVGNKDLQSVCRTLNSTVDCFNEVVEKCGDAIPEIDAIKMQMVSARQQVAQACTREVNVASIGNEDCQQMSSDCLEMMQNLEIGPNPQQACREFQRVKACMDNVNNKCRTDQVDVERYMNGLEQQIAQICGGIDVGPEVAVESKPVEGGTHQMRCFGMLQRCSEESNVTSDTDCDGILSAVDCIDKVMKECPGVFPLRAIAEMDRIDELAKNCQNDSDSTEKVEEVDSAWCASKAQSCLNMISSFSVKHGMESTCSGLQNVVKCFDEVIDKCQSSIADFEKNSAQLFAMKEKITSGCRKGGTGLVVTPNSNQDKCMNKYKKCAGLMAKVPLHEDNNIMCPSLRRSMACIKKVTLECGSLLPESTKQQFSNFENLNRICPVGPSSKSRGRFTEKCSNDIKICDAKANGILSGENIAKTDCRNGFRTLSCYRHVARECRLPKANRKFFKHFKSILTETCERRSTVKHTRGLIDFDIDLPWEDQDWNDDWDDDDSSEDAMLFGDDDFMFD